MTEPVLAVALLAEAVSKEFIETVVVVGFVVALVLAAITSDD